MSSTPKWALDKIEQALDLNAKTLDLSGFSYPHNPLTEFPTRIFQLPNLNSLDLSENQISSIPAKIALLHQLNSLILCGNQINSLPIEMGQLSYLSHLDLSYNLLKNFPMCIDRLQCLNTLIIHSNPIQDIPNELIISPMNGENADLVGLKRYLKTQKIAQLNAFINTHEVINKDPSIMLDELSHFCNEYAIPLNNEITILKNRKNLNAKNYHLGIITHEVYSNEINRINLAILNLPSSLL